MLAVTVHAADSSRPQPAGGSALVKVGPDVVFGGYGGTPLAAARSAAPAVTAPQAFRGTAIPPGPVHRNAPLGVDVPALDAQVPASLPGPGRKQSHASEADSVAHTIEPVTQPAARTPRTVVSAVGGVGTGGEGGTVGEVTDPVQRTPDGGEESVSVGLPAQEAVPAPQGGLAPLVREALTPWDEPASLDQVPATVESGTQPAMAMLSPSVLAG